MKKCLCVAVVAALFAVPTFGQTTLQVRVVTDGDAASVAGGASPINVYVQALLGGTATDGLALLGLNLTDTSAQEDLCDTGAFLLLSSIANFDRNDGLTNPLDLPAPAVTGFSGTCDGASGLWQIGGGQNTIGNTGPTAYPTGAVLAGVGNGTWATIASGTITLVGGETADVILMPNTVFANTIDSGGASPYPVTEVASGDISVAGLTITFGVPCPAADVNCDGTPNVQDLGIIRQGANWNQTPPGNPRADVNGDGTANVQDLGIIRQGANWNVSFAPCVCP